MLFFKIRCLSSRYGNSKSKYFLNKQFKTSRKKLEGCYHIYSGQATIFYFSDTIHFSAKSLTYEMLR